MKKSDFFDDDIVAFDVNKHPHHPEPHIRPLSLRSAYYEWSRPQNRWLKIRESDPEPDQNMPDGSFDGQIIEIEL